MLSRQSRPETDVTTFLTDQRKLLQHKDVQKYLQEFVKSTRPETLNLNVSYADKLPVIICAYKDATCFKHSRARVSGNESSQVNESDFLFNKRFIILYKGSSYFESFEKNHTNSKVDTYSLIVTIHGQLEMELLHINNKQGWTIPPYSGNSDGRRVDEALVFANVYYLSLSIHKQFSEMLELASKEQLSEDREATYESEILRLKQKRAPFVKALKGLGFRSESEFDADMACAKRLEEDWEKQIRTSLPQAAVKAGRKMITQD